MKHLFQVAGYTLQLLYLLLISIIYLIVQLGLILWHFDFVHCKNYWVFLDDVKEALEQDYSDDGWGY